MNTPAFWNDQNKAKEVSRNAERLREELELWENFSVKVDDLLEVANISQMENDESLHDEIARKLAAFRREFEKLEFFVLFSGKYDANDAVVTIHAGTGGTEAQDWAEMLFRMISRYCEKNSLEVQIIDHSRGSEAGIKSIVMIVKGRYSYGYLKSESGVHRLVRISPFDAEKMRHTSFALIEVLPETGDVLDVKIRDEDLKIDTFRAGGHGGQSVNTTDSAVRITHIPTVIIVKCQNERSQHQNKETALKYLRAKLAAHNREEHEKEKNKLRGEYSSAEWGNQIRSYVLQPYKMVKDHRTDYQEHDPDAVLDGKLEGFTESYLRHIQKNKR